jgi:hypothetical protein
MGGSGRTGHAFISYAPVDAAAVDRLQRRLEAAGIPVWRDVSMLPGDDWRATIRRAITDDALVFLACFSAGSLSRGASRQNEELTLAVEQLRARLPDEPWLIPVRFDNCVVPDRDIGGGRTLGSIRPADLFGERADGETERLITAIWRILGGAGQRPGPAAAPEGGPEPGHGPAGGDADSGPVPGNGRPWFRQVRSWDVAIRAAWIGGACVIIGALIALVPYFLGGASSPASAGSRFTYTVNPTKWAPQPVPGLTLATGDVVTITAISGYWVCADAAGAAGIGGNPRYVASYPAWAVPSAPYCSLIGKVGDGPWQELGQQRSFVASRSGGLALTVNEIMPENCPQPPNSTSCYADNTGAITIVIRVHPAS